jgi:hypothetical protein
MAFDTAGSATRRMPPFLATAPARFSTANATGGQACRRRDNQANRRDDQIRALQADPVGERTGQRRAHEAAAEDPNGIQRHHAAAHVVTGPELQGSCNSDIEDAARHAQQEEPTQGERRSQRKSQQDMDDTDRAARQGNRHRAGLGPRCNQQRPRDGAQAQ